MMDDLMGMNQEGMAPSQLYAQLVERLDYLEYLKQDDPEKAEERVENVQELSSMLQRYEEEAGKGPASRASWRRCPCSRTSTTTTPGPIPPC